MKFFTQDEDAIWLPLLYESLPEFYYCCGMIGHVVFGYGAWLKASTMAMKNKQGRQNSRGESPKKSRAELRTDESRRERDLTVTTDNPATSESMKIIHQPKTADNREEDWLLSRNSRPSSGSFHRSLARDTVFGLNPTHRSFSIKIRMRWL